jgi:hypothetical protein
VILAFHPTKDQLTEPLCPSTETLDGREPQSPTIETNSAIKTEVALARNREKGDNVVTTKLKLNVIENVSMIKAMYEVYIYIYIFIYSRVHWNHHQQHSTCGTINQSSSSSWYFVE